MIRILNAEPKGYSDQARNILNEVGELVDDPITRDELISQIPDFEVLIVRLSHQVDQQVIQAGKRLKAIVTATTGLDHIDIEYAQENGIAVLSLQGETEFLRTIKATAEHTWALLLALLRRIPWAFNSVQNGHWDRDAFRGLELDGKQLGLLGLGRVGKIVAAYGQVFGMRVGAYDPDTEDWEDHVYQYQSLNELLKNSQILSIHIPLNHETKGLIGKPELVTLPRGALLVNTSRGEIIDETALVTALENKHLAGAALDFLPTERNEVKRQASPLLAYARRHDNLLITPHLAGATFESMEKTEIFMAKKLAQFIKES